MASGRGNPWTSVTRKSPTKLDLSGLNDAQKKELRALATSYKARSATNSSQPNRGPDSQAASASSQPSGSHAAPVQPDPGKQSTSTRPSTTQGRSPSSGLPPSGKKNSLATQGRSPSSGGNRPTSPISIHELSHSPAKRVATRSTTANLPKTATADVVMADSDASNIPDNQQRQQLPNPVSNLVVIFDNITNMLKKQLEPELCRVAPWLQPTAVDFMRSGGMRVKCQTPADADRLLKRDGFPADAFGGRFTVHRPGKIDDSRPISLHLAKDLRSVVTTRLPLCYDASDLCRIFGADYVEEVRDIPPKDLNRPPLRIIVLKSKELRDDAVENGLRFFNRRVRARPLRAPVLPLFCRKCSGYGHTAVDCKAKQFTCAKCSGNHDTATCNIQRRDAQCPNCPIESRDHFATYRGCPAFKDATKNEIERRQHRLNAKLEARERRRNAGRQQPANNQAFTNTPAPVQPGIPFATVVRGNASLEQPPPQLPQPQQPQPDLRMIWTALLKIQNDLDVLRKQQTTLSVKVYDIEKQQTRFEERQDGLPHFDDDYDDAELMEVGNSDHNDSRTDDQNHA